MLYLTNGTLRQDNRRTPPGLARANIWASGALIKDRLFAYGLVSYGKQENDTWGKHRFVDQRKRRHRAPRRGC
jgi:hypothetical protein